jgi:hypothetical protein
MKGKKNIRLAVLILSAVALALFLASSSMAGSLEPPASAVDASGNPVPTMTTPPSWGKKLPASERFAVLSDFNNAAVLDKETGLVWEKSPSSTLRDWTGAMEYCYSLELGGRQGWHLPTIEQLASLTDTSITSFPSLPIGHPFTNLQDDLPHWTANTHSYYPYEAFFYYVGDGYIDHISLGNDIYVWCVRGGQSREAY